MAPNMPRAAGVAPVRLELNLTAADGRMDNAGVVVGECRFVVNAGVYVVCVGTQVYKVAVR